MRRISSATRRSGARPQRSRRSCAASSRAAAPPSHVHSVREKIASSRSSPALRSTTDSTSGEPPLGVSQRTA
ncbi:hypothetical protein HK414_23670 [Ramlibacter terrae]|uniref:Uncharacterized protein n=1 Tax=Ramlibacter terrae TaxID=2732511 RepID=A0ABX6P574_9BURK|nr:hypothetical protein HK414_23670 [Ramlibacter terrae]